MICASNAPRHMDSRHTPPLTWRKILSSSDPPNRCIMNHHGWLLVRYTGGRRRSAAKV